MEVLIAVAVGGVLTILTICLIIIYVLVSRDSWCSCLRHHQHRQGSDISELGRSVIIKCIVGRFYIPVSAITAAEELSYFHFTSVSTLHPSIVSRRVRDSVSSTRPVSHSDRNFTF